MASRFPVPWGLFIALGLYAAVTTGYIGYAYWTSPDYQASEHYAAARHALGRDGGRHLNQAQLEEAYRQLVLASQLVPDVKELQDELESLNWRFEERHWRVPADLRSAAEAQAAMLRRAQEQRAPLLAVGTRERGWDPQTLLAGPTRAAGWSSMGGVLILIVWAYLRFSARRVKSDEKEVYLRQVEQEVRERGEQRRPPRG